MQTATAPSLDGFVQSFEVTRGSQSGDLLSAAPRQRRLKVGLLACGYFEYWRMYPQLRGQVEQDMRRIAERLSEKHQIVFPGFVDTLDTADAAGRQFRDQNIDALIVTESTYCPDYFVHQALVHLPASMPICIYASQAHGETDFTAGYDQALRNSGPMGLVQLTGGFRKMGKFPHYEVVVGPIDDPQAFAEIDRFIQVRTTIANLKHMTVGLVGHVFRGMYDFEFDKTAVAGALGPQVLNVDIRHLIDLLPEVSEDDSQAAHLVRKVKSTCRVVGLEDGDLLRAARLAIALQLLVNRYRLQGLVLLGQHFIELQANSTTYLGLTELLQTDQVHVATEGDVLGCIMSKVLKDFTGHTAFFGEWEEVDLKRNAVMLLGHGFIDPREARRDQPVQVNPASEAWGFEGNSVGFQATYEPGPVTMTHVVQDPGGWRLLICEGEVMDLPPLPINESSLLVQVQRPVKEFLREIMMHGFPHHAITVPGRVSDHLELFGRQLGFTICRV